MNPIEKRIAEVFKDLALTEGIVTQDNAEQLVQRCHIKGLTTEDILDGKTPKLIAERWMHRRMSVHVEHVKSEDVDNRHYPLLPFSKIVQDDIRNDGGNERWTFPILLRAKASEVDVERLKQAVESVLAHHPVFSMHIEEDGTHWYDSSYRSPYVNIEVTSSDTYVYLSIKLNRILGDAVSFVLLAQNIWRAYRGEELPYDDYVQYLQKYEQQTHTPEYAVHAEWLAQKYDAPTYPLLPKQDSPEGLLDEYISAPYVVQPDYTDCLTDFSRKKHISINAFFCLATAMAIMESNETNSAGLTWAYMGRETRDEMNIFGSLHKDIPMKIDRCSLHKEELFAQLHKQMQQGILHSDYPFTLLSPKDSPWHSAVNVLVQPDISEAFDGCPINFEILPVEHSAESYCMLDIDITLTPLTLTFNYSPRHYKQESIRRFAELIDKNARQLLGIDSTL